MKPPLDFKPPEASAGSLPLWQSNTPPAPTENSEGARKRVPWASRVGTTMHGFKIEAVEVSRRTRVALRCRCGSLFWALGDSLRNREVRSCGCHGSGKTNHPLYNTWLMMRARCRHPKHPQYRRYGGRGIRVCERWDRSFSAFCGDVGEKPSPKHSLDRIDNEKGYSPDNCRWADRSTQANNVRSNVWVSAFGNRKTVSQWADFLGIPREFIRTHTQRSRYPKTLEQTEQLWISKHSPDHAKTA